MSCSRCPFWTSGDSVYTPPLSSDPPNPASGAYRFLDLNQLPPAGETACPTYFAKRLIQQGGARAFPCPSNGHNQWSASQRPRKNQFTLSHCTSPRSMAQFQP